MTANELIRGARPLTVSAPLLRTDWRRRVNRPAKLAPSDLIHAKFVRDVEPGEIVVINQDGLTSVQAFPEQQRRALHFEYVYFARPDSTIANRNVYKVRAEMGPRTRSRISDQR
jgi:glutamine phosphoribosylpyrophosphate amidotransferase